MLFICCFVYCVVKKLPWQNLHISGTILDFCFAVSAAELIGFRGMVSRFGACLRQRPPSWKRSRLFENALETGGGGNENAGFSFLCGRKHLETKLFEIDGVLIVMWFTWTSFPQIQIFQRSVDGKHLIGFQSETSDFKLLRRSEDGKHLKGFQSETAVFKFLRRTVDGKHLLCFQSETSDFKFLRLSVDWKHLMCFQSETYLRFQIPPVWSGGRGLRPRPHYAGRIWKRSFISPVIGLPSTRIRRNCPPKTELYENALKNGGIWKPSFAF